MDTTPDGSLPREEQEGFVGTLLVGISQNNETGAAGCDSRCYQPDVNDVLDVNIVKETVVDGVLNSPVYEKTYIKYDIEPHFTLLSAGTQAGHENVIATLRNTALSLIDVEIPVDVLLLASSLHSYLVEDPDGIPGIEGKEFLLVGVQTEGVDIPCLRLCTVDYFNGVVEVLVGSSVSVGMGIDVANNVLEGLNYEETTEVVAHRAYEALYEVCKIEPYVGGDLNVITFRLERGTLQSKIWRFPQRGFSWIYWEEERLKELLTLEMLKIARQTRLREGK